jgi:hypothetical protein
MRMNSVPRSVAEPLGTELEERTGRPAADHTARSTRSFIEGLSADEWEAVAPRGSQMTGEDYRKVWRRLSGGFD